MAEDSTDMTNEDENIQDADSQSGEGDEAPKRRGTVTAIIIAAIVVIIAVIVLLVVMCSGSGQMSEEEFYEDLQQVDVAADCAVPGNYVLPSDYTIEDLQIEDQNTQSYTVEGTTLSFRTVTFSCALVNANFRTELTAEAYYTRPVEGEEVVDDTLQIADYVDKLSAHTVPLKGVDGFVPTLTGDVTVDYADMVAGGAEFGDFSSTLDQSGDTYTSTATQELTYDQWFATDTGTWTMTFTFDEEQGWVPDEGQETPSATNTQTDWKIEGKALTIPKKEQKRKDLDGTLEGSLTFDEISPVDGSGTDYDVQAEYELNYTPTDSSAKGFSYDSVDISSGDTKLTGSLQHELGADMFSFKLGNGQTGKKKVVLKNEHKAILCTEDDSGDAIDVMFKIEPETYLYATSSNAKMYLGNASGELSSCFKMND
ncbi:MAG: hypothetical protein LUD25_05065 [Coriobacteriaceae bacterium]|nr:hypothetical protein [Coriobacteriaceae bacterium]